MATQEINESKWETFCQRFDEAQRGTLVSLEVIYHDGTTSMIARNEALRQFKFTRTEGCTDQIEIVVGESPARVVQHQVVDPIHMRIREPEGAQKVLEIDAESGSVEMHFSSGRIGAILKDIEMTAAR